MKFKDKIGVVTVLYNSSNVVDEFFFSIINQTYDNLFLYVIDNNSPDNSYELMTKLAESHQDRVFVIHNDNNLGVATANNIGIKLALQDSCDYVLLSNNDTVFESDTVEKLYTGLVTNNATMAVPKIINHFSNKIWAAGGRFLKFKGTTRHIGTGANIYDDNYNKVYKCDYSPTCFMLIKKEVFSRVGYMDDNFFVYYDDTDYLWRATQLGHERLFYVPSSIVRHKESSCTEGEFSDFSLRFLHRNAILFVLKHFNLYRVMLAILYRCLQFIFKYSFVLNRKQLKIVFDSYIEGYNLFRNIYR